jgi:hypothetical protein
MSPDGTIAGALHRRAAARRLEPLDGRWGADLGARDPLASWPPAPRTPGRYGLTDDELRAEADRLLASGWLVSEIRATLVRPQAAAA